MFEKLMKEIAYAKKSVIPRYHLYEIYGRISMANELNMLNTNEYMELNHECVCEGINNPKFFN